jgi:hypothetical protein
MKLKERRITFGLVLIVLASCAGMKVDMLGGTTGRSLALGMLIAVVVVIVGTFAAWPWIGPEDDE